MKAPFKISLKSEGVIILLLLLAIVSSFWFYANMPEIVPIHWNAAGQVDGYGSRAFGAFFFPALIVGIYLLLLFIPYLDPKKERYQEFSKVYWIFRLIFVLFFILVYGVSSLNGVGYDIPVGKIIPAMIGLLFIIMGNYMGKIKPNWFVGIRTPWTLSSEEIWNKTHRFGGKVFMVMGLLFLLASMTDAGYVFILVMTLTIILMLLTVGYSYWLYHKEQKEKEDHGDDNSN